MSQHAWSARDRPGVSLRIAGLPSPFAAAMTCAGRHARHARSRAARGEAPRPPALLHGARRDHGRVTMSTEEVEVVVVGGGQAGVAMSEHLGNVGVPHVVLERDRIAEKWRTGRWDSLVANGPAWHDRFPGLEFDGDPEAFAPKEQVADYFEVYAAKIGAPVRTGVEVASARKNEGRPGFTVETSRGIIDTRFVVAATGPFQTPVIPPIIPSA